LQGDSGRAAGGDGRLVEYGQAQICCG
jgi:hypothetical protein